MGMISRILLILTICVIIVAGCGKNAGDRIDFGEAQVVSIICEKQRGSGVIYEVMGDRVVIVTAAHVVEDTETAEIVWSAGKGSVVLENTKMIKVAGLDLAFLTVEGASAERTVGSISAADCEIGTKLSLQGYDAEGVYIAAEGQVTEPWIYTEDFSSHMMIARAQAIPGMSGGGVFDSAGNFVGIICGMDAAGQVAVLPGNVIAAEYIASLEE